jgi:mono/diheme cytochrome c family protein
MKKSYAILLSLVLFTGLAALASTEEAEVHEGLFTEEQAERGDEAYQQHCASCHGTELEGGGHFPALIGERFWNRWEGRTAWELYDYTHTTMPLGQGGTLADETYADIFAFMLAHYGYPAGDEELVPDEDVLDFALEPQPDEDDEDDG